MKFQMDGQMRASGAGFGGYFERGVLISGGRDSIWFDRLPATPLFVGGVSQLPKQHSDIMMSIRQGQIRRSRRSEQTQDWPRIMGRPVEPFLARDASLPPLWSLQIFSTCAPGCWPAFRSLTGSFERSAAAYGDNFGRTLAFNWKNLLL